MFSVYVCITCFGSALCTRSHAELLCKKDTHNKRNEKKKSKGKNETKSHSISGIKRKWKDGVMVYVYGEQKLNKSRISATHIYTQSHRANAVNLIVFLCKRLCGVLQNNVEIKSIYYWLNWNRKGMKRQRKKKHQQQLWINRICILLSGGCDHWHFLSPLLMSRVFKPFYIVCIFHLL